MEKPLLKQFGSLLPADFEQHPVWIACHGIDDEEPWFDETDEETFRPWTGDLPAAPSDGMLLTKATIELADAAQFSGFMTPSFDAGDLGTQQPQIFVGERRFGFWGGMFGVPEPQRQEFYSVLNKSFEQIFPLRFSVAPNLATGETTGEVRGFYRSVGGNIEIER